ncbi:hypothetical protein D3C72_2044830 [compost metagenome]
MRGGQDGLVERFDLTVRGLPLSQRGLDFRAQTQFGRVAQIPGLIGAPGGRQHIALIAVEQWNRHRQAHHIHPIAIDLAVLAANTHGQIGNPLRLLQPQRGLTLIDLQFGQAQFGGFIQSIE